MDIHTTAVKSVKDPSHSDGKNELSRMAAKTEGPMLGASRAPKTESVSAGNEQKHAQLLVVEDNESVGCVIQRMLSSSGAQFEFASSLEEAVSKLAAMQDCKVLLTDFYLGPSESDPSIPLIKAAKEKGAFVLLMSGTMQEALAELDAAGIAADEYFEKPSGLVDATKRAKTLLSGSG
ncbi:Uncharacterised protein [uncultured archaeon]|nr:Uncharacterised protein [uncultured archaeon]